MILRAMIMTSSVTTNPSFLFTNFTQIKRVLELKWSTFISKIVKINIIKNTYNFK